MGGGLQSGGFGAEGIGVSGTVFVSRGIAREEHRCKPQWQRHVPLPEQRNPQDGNPRTLSGVAFLRLILQHILPKGYRRARNFGFLHPNSKLIPLVQLIKRVVLPPPQSHPVIRCKCCGGVMKIVRTRIKTFTHRLRILASNREMAT